MSRIKKHKYEIAFILIVLVQVIYISCMFGINKQGFHSDELWNYGFANSTDGAHIYKVDDGYDVKNVDSWQSSENLRKYITIDKDEIFNYAAVYQNAACDLHAPLGFMMLHFICSFFPGTWSKWYCFVLNMICFVIMQMYIYKLVRDMTKNRMAGILAVSFFGFTMGAQNVFIYLRIYAPATMFGVMLVYYSNMLYKMVKEGNIKKNVYVKIFLVTLAGSLTLHLFLTFAFIVTVMYCLYYLFGKRFRQFFVYGLVMAGSVIASLLIFPATINHIPGLGGKQLLTYATKKYPFYMQNKMYWAFMTNDLFGIHNSIWKTMTGTYILYAIGLILFIALPLCFVFRHETWLKKAICWIKYKVIDIFKNIKKSSYTLIVMLAVVIVTVAIAANKTSILQMGRSCTRYVFVVYPVLACLAVILVWDIVLYFIKNSKVQIIICILLSVVFVVLSNALASKNYYFKHYEDGKTLTMLEDDSNCIIVSSGYWLLTCYTNELYNTQNYYIADYESALNDTYDSDIINSEDPLYLILDVSEMDKADNINIMGQSVYIEKNQNKEYKSEDYLSYFESLDISDKVEYVGTDAVFGRTVKIYRLN